MSQMLSLQRSSLLWSGLVWSGLVSSAHLASILGYYGRGTNFESRGLQNGINRGFSLFFHGFLNFFFSPHHLYSYLKHISIHFLFTYSSNQFHGLWNPEVQCSITLKYSRSQTKSIQFLVFTPYLSNAYSDIVLSPILKPSHRSISAMFIC